MPENRSAAGNAVLLLSVALSEEADKYHSRGVFLMAREGPHGSDISISDVSRVIASCLRMPPHEMRTTHHRPEDFLILFDHPHQRTLALWIGVVRVKGVHFNIIPWTEHAHAWDITWWYHIRMAIENLPTHARNLGALKEMLGEVCLFDKMEKICH